MLTTTSLATNPESREPDCSQWPNPSGSSTGAATLATPPKALCSTSVSAKLPELPIGMASRNHTATLAARHGLDGSFREEDLVSKAFETQYYNAAIHTAALAVPEFFPKALE